MTTTYGSPRDSAIPTVVALVVGAVVLELGSWLVESSSLRFTRVVVLVVLVLGLEVARRSRLAPWLVAAVVAVVAVGVVGGGADAAVALLAVVGGFVSGEWVLRARARSSVPGANADADELGDVAPDAADPGHRHVRRGGRAWLVPAAAWLATSVLVNLVMSIAGAAAGTSPDGRIVWDASNFLAIATDGYRSDLVLAASFPGYAMLIRGAHAWLGLDPELAAVLLSNVAGLAATLLFWSWSSSWLDRRSQRLGLALFLLFPYSFMLFGVAYADGLLLALVLGSLLAVERDRPLLAGLLGAAATFTRPNALALVPALVVLVAERSGALSLGSLGQRSSPLLDRLKHVRVVPSRLRARDAGVLLSLGGIGGYMYWMRTITGDPLFFWTVQTTQYGHRPFADLRTWLKVEFINRPAEFVHNWPDALNQVASVAVLVVAVLSLMPAARRLGWGYAVLGMGAIATLWVTASGFSPAGRYLLPYLPVVIVLSAPALCRRPVAARVLLSAFLLGTVVLAAGFASAFRLNW